MTRKLHTATIFSIKNSRLNVMRYPFMFLCLCFLGLAPTGVLAAQTSSPFVQIMKARRLYGCSNFLRAAADSVTDKHQKETLHRSYERFLAQATIEALAVYPGDPGSPELAKALGDSGQKDFERFMASLDSLPTVEERNDKIGQYANSCLKLLPSPQTQAEPVFQSALPNQEQQHQIDELAEQRRPTGRDLAPTVAKLPELPANKHPLANGSSSQLPKHRATTGLVVYDLSSELAQALGLPTASGAVVATVTKGSPADQAGIAEGDVILRIGQDRIENASNLGGVVAALQPGGNIRIEIYRQKSRRIDEVNLNVGEANN